VTTTALHGPPAGLPRHPVLDDPRRRRRGVLWFLGLTFGTSWSLWWAAHQLGHSLSNPAVQLLTAAFVPAGAAAVVRAVVTREGFADAGLRPRWRAAWRHHVAAATLPLVMLACTALAAAAAGWWRPPQVDATTLLLFLAAAPFLVVLAAPVYWGEEFGWTAYLRMRLFPGRPYASTLATGVVWGVWHWPLTFTGYFDGTDLGGPVDIAVQLVLWVVLSVLLEFVLSWSFWASGTVWTASVLHAGNNLVLAVGTGWLVGDAEGSLNASTFLMCLGIAPVCLAVVVRGHRRARRSPGRRAV
jgi:hypothetical protein